MPHYDYECSSCQIVFELSLPMSENDRPEKEPCPECQAEGTVKQAYLTAPALGDPIRMGIKKPDAGWGDVLRKVKKAHPRGHWDNKKYVPQSGR